MHAVDTQRFQLASRNCLDWLRHPSRAKQLALCCALAAVGCAADLATPSDESASEEPVGVDGEALTHGYTVGNPDYSGVVALQVYDKLKNEYTTFCTGALLNNNSVLTAAHCLPGVASKSITVVMGTQATGVSRRTPSPTVDIAVLRLSAPLRMWNWNVSAFATSPAALNTTDYHRPFYSNSNNTLNGRTLVCFGYGGVPKVPPMTEAWFTAEFPSIWTYGNVPAVGMTGTSIFAGSIDEDGDSGSPCLTGTNSYGDPVATVISSAASGYQFGATGAADFSYWAALQAATP